MTSSPLSPFYGNLAHFCLKWKILGYATFCVGGSGVVEVGWPKEALEEKEYITGKRPRCTQRPSKPLEHVNIKSSYKRCT